MEDNGNYEDRKIGRGFVGDGVYVTKDGERIRVPGEYLPMMKILDDMVNRHVFFNIEKLVRVLCSPIETRIRRTRREDHREDKEKDRNSFE